MGLKDDLNAQVKETFRLKWDEEVSQAVPAPEDLRLNANHAKDLEQATLLYADLDGSTTMVDNWKWWFSAEVYKCFLRCAGQIIRSEGGVITAYDGDRIMAVFTGDAKNTSAVRAALKINYAVIHIIQPALKVQYVNSEFQVRHTVGIDTSQLRAARIGVRGDNDLVWIGRAANYAAKLTSLDAGYTWITKAVFDNLNAAIKLHEGLPMWEKRLWTKMENMEIYRSSYWWTIP